jgi:hypothetical protein
MKHNGSLPFSQKPTPGPYREPYESSPHLPTYFSKIQSNIIFPSTSKSSEWSFPFSFSDKKNEIWGK